MLACGVQIYTQPLPSWPTTTAASTPLSASSLSPSSASNAAAYHDASSSSDFDGPPRQLIAVHVGLHAASPVLPQIEALRARDASATVLQVGAWGRFEAFSGRNEVAQMHPELAGQAILVSGHHGWLHIKGDRLICDSSGTSYE